MSRPTTHFTVTVLASVMLLSGCGSKPHDVGGGAGVEGARETVTTVAKAVVEGDGARACSLLSARAQRAFEQAHDSAGCIQAVAAASRGLSMEQRSALEQIDETDLRVDGDRARATGASALALARSLGVSRLALARSEDHWVVA